MRGSFCGSGDGRDHAEETRDQLVNVEAPEIDEGSVASRDQGLSPRRAMPLGAAAETPWKKSLLDGLAYFDWFAATLADEYLW